MRNPLTSALAAAVALTAVLALAGCGQGVTKAGSPSPQITTLRIGAVDPSEEDLAYFATTLDHLSDHRLRATVDTRTYYTETPDAGARLTAAVESGAVDLAYVPSRDWAATGDPDFRALQAPLMVGSASSAVAVAKSPVAGELLDSLHEQGGAVGLALVPSEPRRLITRTPVLSAADLAGAKIRYNPSRQSADLLTALGAVPTTILAADDVREGLSSATLDGVETSPSYVSSNSYNRTAPYLSSLGLFGKFEVLTAGKAGWAKLSTGDQKLIRRAASATVAHAVAEVPVRESKEMSLLCANGVVVVQPSGAASADLKARALTTSPTDAATRRFMATITSTVAGTGPQSSTDTSWVPKGCAVATTATDAVAAHTAALTAGSGSGQTSGQTTGQTSGQTFPTGTYTVTTTKQVLADAGMVGPDWQADITFTWHFNAGGTFTETQVPDYPDQGPLAGTYTVTGDRMHLQYGSGTDPATAPDDFDETVQWSFYQGVATFTPIAVQDDASRVIYSQPWHKVS